MRRVTENIMSYACNEMTQRKDTGKMGSRKRAWPPGPLFGKGGGAAGAAHAPYLF